MSSIAASAPKVRVFISLWLFGLCTSALYGEDRDHPHHVHGTNGFDLGLSVGSVRLKPERETAIGLHAHIMKRLGEEGFKQYFSLGIGTEAIFSDEPHYSLLGSLGIHPWRDLKLIVSPGVQWAEHEEKWESDYATHYEAMYSFDCGRYHLGPVIGYSKTDHEEHYMFGIHIGFHVGR